MDLLFPHHECEIAQSMAALGKDSVRYWIHNNMITVNGQKMGKSLGNFITLNEFFSANIPSLEKAYSPMAVRFFILQAQYRGTLDFSNKALQASEKGFGRLTAAYASIKNLPVSQDSNKDLADIKQKCYDALLDDLNTPILIAQLFEVVRIINSVKAGLEIVSEQDIILLQELFDTFAVEILGLMMEQNASTEHAILEGVINLLLTLRVEAKERKDYATSDNIRNQLEALGVKIKDTKTGFEWII